LKLKVVLTIAIFVSLVGGIGYLGYRSAQQSEQNVIAPPLTVAVSRGDVRLSVAAPGQVVYPSQAEISTPTKGMLTEIAVKAGDFVDAGQIIARLGSLGSPPRDNSDNTQNELIIETPFAGIVLEVLVRPGETLNAGQTIAIIVDPKNAQVQASIVEEDWPLLEVGQSTELFFDAAPEVFVTGVISRLVPHRISDDRPLYPIYISLPEGLPDGVVEGMTVDVSILIDQRQNVLVMPRSFVGRGGHNTIEVDVWKSGEVSPRAVELGLYGDVYVEILSGLEEGEQVVSE